MAQDFPEDDGADEFNDVFATAVDARTPLPPEETSPHRSLEFLAGRERGWTDCALAYGVVLEAALRASGLSPQEIARVRHWIDSRVSPQG